MHWSFPFNVMLLFGSGYWPVIFHSLPGFSTTVWNNWFTVETANSLRPMVISYSSWKEYFQHTKVLFVSCSWPGSPPQDLFFYLHRRDDQPSGRVFAYASAGVCRRSRKPATLRYYPAKHYTAFTTLSQLQVPMSSTVKQEQTVPETWINNPMAINNVKAGKVAGTFVSPASFSSVPLANRNYVRTHVERPWERTEKEWNLHVSCSCCLFNPWILNRMAKENSFLQISEKLGVVEK